MSVSPLFRVFQFKKCFIRPAQYAIQSRNYAVQSKSYADPFGGGGKKGGKKFTKTQKVEVPVEKDINKLLTHVCGLNIYKTGEDVKLKPDSEYPEWLWSIPTEPPKLSDLDPNTKAYWRYVRKMGLQRNNRRIKFRRF